MSIKRKIEKLKIKVIENGDKVKKIQINIFLFFFILIYLIQNFILKTTAIPTLFSIFASYIYFVLIFFLINRNSHIGLFELKKIFIFYKKNKFNYIKWQFKNVFTEEFLIRYIPFCLLILVANDFFYVHILIFFSTAFFTWIHRFNNIIALIEFFLFFSSVFYFFTKFNDFGVLFFPHIIRNIMIEYQINKYNYN